jgi:hypothetical protein
MWQGRTITEQRDALKRATRRGLIPAYPAGDAVALGVSAPASLREVDAATGRNSGTTGSGDGPGRGLRDGG